VRHISNLKLEAFGALALSGLKLLIGYVPCTWDIILDFYTTRLEAQLIFTKIFS